jgi:hypothetical protein
MAFDVSQDIVIGVGNGIASVLGIKKKCKVSEWSPWHPLNCDYREKQWRERKILQKPDGISCPSLSQTQKCKELTWDDAGRVIKEAKKIWTSIGKNENEKELNKHAETYEEEIAKLKRTQKILEEKITKFEAEKDELQNKFNQLKGEKDKNQELKQQLEDKNASNENLKNQLRGEKVKLLEKEKIIEALEKENELSAQKQKNQNDNILEQKHKIEGLKEDTLFGKILRKHVLSATQLQKS